MIRESLTSKEKTISFANTLQIIIINPKVGLVFVRLTQDEKGWSHNHTRGEYSNEETCH